MIDAIQAAWAAQQLHTLELTAALVAGLQEYVNSGQLAESDVDAVLLNMGQPLLEVFLRKDEATGRLRSCATAIVPTDPSQASPASKSAN